MVVVADVSGTSVVLLVVSIGANVVNVTTVGGGVVVVSESALVGVQAAAITPMMMATSTVRDMRQDDRD